MSEQTQPEAKQAVHNPNMTRRQRARWDAIYGTYVTMMVAQASAEEQLRRQMATFTGPTKAEQEPVRITGEQMRGFCAVARGIADLAILVDP